MNLRYMTMTAVGVCAVAAACQGADRSNDRDSLQGSWSVVSAERNGALAEDILDHELVVVGDAFTIRSKGKTIFEGTFALDSSPTPCAIDFKHTGGELNGKTWRGIYKLDGTTLCICDNAVDIQKERPTGFKTMAESGLVLVVFKRAG